MPPPRLVWTPEMIAALRSMRGQGVRITVCAERIGVAPRGAFKKARELGIHGRRRREGHAFQPSPSDPVALRQRWDKKLPAMREAVKRAATDD
jgi:hypothetical protein